MMLTQDNCLQEDVVCLVTTSTWGIPNNDAHSG